MVYLRFADHLRGLVGGRWDLAGGSRLVVAGAGMGRLMCVRVMLVSRLLVMDGMGTGGMLLLQHLQRARRVSMLMSPLLLVSTISGAGMLGLDSLLVGNVECTMFGLRVYGLGARLES